MGQRPHRDAVDAGSCDLGQRAVGDTAGGFQLDLVPQATGELAQPRHHLPHDRGRHVVEQHDVRAAAYGRHGLRFVAGFRCDVPLRAHVRSDVPEHLFDRSTGEVDVILFHHDLIEEANPVVAPTTDAHRVLVEGPHPRRRFASVEDPCARAFHEVHALASLGRDARHPLDDVERSPLGDEERSAVAVGMEDDVAGYDCLPIGDDRLDGRGRVQIMERTMEGLSAGEHAALFGHQRRATAAVLGDSGAGRQVSAHQVLGRRTVVDDEPEVFGECTPNQVVEGVVDLLGVIHRCVPRA